MKKLGITLVLLGSIFAILRGIGHLYVSYKYSQTIESNWDLADRASTISQKSEYIDKFIASLESCNLNGTHDAILFDTPENSFDENIKAIKSLQSRLKTISTMKESSFEYQTAMQQITAQEQGEAKNMLNVFQGCWEKENYYTFWNKIMIVSFLIIQILMIVIGFMIILE